MKKLFPVTVLALASILLSAFSAAPAPAALEPSMGVRIVSDFNSDGSGKLSFEIDLSQEFMALLKSFGGNDADLTCDTFYESSYDDWEMTETNRDGALVCTAATSFEDLDEYENLIQGDFGSASFTRLEIEGGRFYYDLNPNITGSSAFGELNEGAGFTIEVFWILKMPGEVVDSNADEKAGQTLTWNILEMNSSAHIRAESKTGAALDPTLTILAVLGLLCCCGLVVAIAAVVLYLVLRKKNNPAAAAS
ncbi:MAG: hypothetical protein A3K46_03485 [Chloroflexi bacterium RBG_13_60_9]|nr:MAG: hypothetical protein A3K46_03485 [Chloroflexi bacterium RBG_13_60_9]